MRDGFVTGRNHRTISVLLSHSDIGTTLNLYVHLNMEKKRNYFDRMQKIFK